MKRRWHLAIVVLATGLYVGTIVVGLEIRNFSILQVGTASKGKRPWKPPSETSIPDGPQGDSIRYGALLFDETPFYSPKHVGAKISCTSCHAEGGIQPYASPMVGLPPLFPMYNQRAGHAISLRDRIQECFVRSENGSPLAYGGREMQALVDYINWLSKPQPDMEPFVGRGLIALPPLKPNPEHGAQVYATHCAGCHGKNGEGRAPLFPALWGPQSYNDGAGMNNVAKMAPFVQHNMPQNRKGILSPQDAFDVSAFIHSQPRPAFNQTYKHF